ncbi:MAG: bifunctional diaminohydroxyphosphoribosylaminopyrimidine deaminase/5-amino-6-(5-phosphoribosylamino)uracil reductase RibD [Bacteroidaceae bacterium]|nr:bifunctional diaminohydroxyphosphoribosylaminopyrimidine deaminase/5-amino-6-(5-phosphoribosylamino)uracil reductase RibD [Bacteroidaceae bacterium]
MEKYIHRCIELALQGEQYAAPNPMVGAVIVHNDRIIGEGYHAKCGEAHAEVNAVRSVKEADRHLLPESTIYVSLEPCAHYGKTPPCAELIIKERIPNVVVGCVDPFAKVKGRGIQMLRDAGINVVVGVCEKECLELNRKFITFHEKKRPYITLKWARTPDGYIDAKRTDCNTPPLAISNEITRLRGHRLRTTHQAILVGHNTLILDKPSLLPRYWHGPAPLRVVLGKVTPEELPEGFVAYKSIEEALLDLHARNIQSLLVEGGTKVLQSFIDQGLWDEAWEEIGNTPLGTEGVGAPTIPNAQEHHFEYGNHHFIHREK